MNSASTYLMDESVKDGSMRWRPILLHEVGVKERLIEVSLKVADQRLKGAVLMIVADGIARPLPDMLLGIEVRAGDRLIHQFQAGVFRQESLDLSALMPGGTIQEHQEMVGGKEQQQEPDEVRRDRAGLLRGREGNLTPPLHFERAVEGGHVPLRGDAHQGRLADRSPDAREGGLEVQAHLIHAQDGKPLTILLQPVGHFFQAPLQSPRSPARWHATDTGW